MSKQVLSIEQMLHLQELGFDTSNASASWYKPDMDTEYMLMFGHLKKEELVGNEENIPSYTLQDVLDALPASIGYGRKLYVLKLDMFNKIICYRDTASDDTLVFVKFMEIPLIDAAYSMLCWAIDNKFVETNKNE